MALSRADIQRAFQNALGRAASQQDEDAYFIASQSGDSSDSQIYGAISNSREADLNTDPVLRFYQAAFGRTADKAGLELATDYIRQFGATADTYKALANQFVQSTEFQTRYGSDTTVDAAYVQALYRDILGRDPSASEITSYVSGSNGYVTRGQVLYAIAQSNEAVQHTETAVNAFLQNAAEGNAVYSGSIVPTFHPEPTTPFNPPEPTQPNPPTVPTDVTAPVATISLGSNSSLGLTTGQSTSVAIKFSEAVTGFDLTDLSATGGTLSNFEHSATDPTLYTATFLAGQGSIAQIQLTGDYTDLAGNAGSSASAGTFIFPSLPPIVVPPNPTDTVPPNAVITLGNNSSLGLTTGQSTSVAIKFSEAVTGFDLTDLSATGGTLSNFEHSATDPTLYTATFLAGQGSIAQIQLTGDYTDLAGNAGSSASAGTFIFPSLPPIVVPPNPTDTVSPIAAITIADTFLSAGQFTSVSIQFSEAVKGFDQTDLVVTGGALSNFAQSTTNPLLYSATFQAGQGGPASIDLAAGSYTDLADNPGGSGNSAAFVLPTFTIPTDFTAPTATINLGSYVLPAGQSTSVSIQFSEAVKGFDQSDLTVANGALSDFAQSTTDPTLYTATFHAGQGGPASIDLAAGSYTDLADNPGYSGTGTAFIIPQIVLPTFPTIPTIPTDFTAPTATISTGSSFVSPGRSTSVSFHFSEAITGFDQSDLTVTGGTLSNFEHSVTDPMLYTATFLAGEGGRALIDLAADSYTDLAGNPGGAANAQVDVFRTIPTTPINTIGSSIVLDHHDVLVA